MLLSNTWRRRTVQSFAVMVTAIKILGMYLASVNCLFLRSVDANNVNKAREIQVLNNAKMPIPTFPTWLAQIFIFHASNAKRY